MVIKNKNNNNKSGVTEIIVNDITYKIWNTNLIEPFIFKFLKENYSDSLIVPEINKIDYIIFDNKSNDIIPVEIQKTPLRDKIFSHNVFENSIRKQLDDNIINYGICWFFFDSEYHKYLQSDDIKNNISINLTWLVKLMKENTLKVFVIRYDGIVKELTTKDFDFLKNISQTCSIGEDIDERILNRNKLKIYRDVIRGYKFTQEEISNFYKEFNISDTDDKGCYSYFIKSNNDRCKLYGYIISYIGNLISINNMLDMNIVNMDSCSKNAKRGLIYLGIFDNVGTCGKGNLLKFVDKFNICEYFPGYIRQSNEWNKYKNTNLNYDVFERISNGSYKEVKSLMDY